MHFTFKQKDFEATLDVPPGTRRDVYMTPFGRSHAMR